MAYTDTTWTAALVSVAEFNTSVRDNFRFFYAGVGFNATKTAQSVGSGSNVKMQGNTEVWDSHGYYDNATNYRFTPLIAGKYLVTVSASMTSVSGSVMVAALKGGATECGVTHYLTLSGTDSPKLSASGVVSFNGTTDYIECYVLHNTGAARNVDSYFSAVRVGT